MKKQNKNILWIILIIAITIATNAVTYSVASGVYEKSIAAMAPTPVPTPAPTPAPTTLPTETPVPTLTPVTIPSPIPTKDTVTCTGEYEDIEYILQELKNDTITASDDQEAYDQVVKMPDKSFTCQENGTVYILNNGEIFSYGWQEPLDTNEYYQAIIEKFIRLYYDGVIKIDDLVKVGFMREVECYGFGNVYGDKYEDYKALIRYYLQQRTILELQMEKYFNEKSTVDKVKKCYENYTLSKNMLSDYINSITPGDL